MIDPKGETVVLHDVRFCLGCPKEYPKCPGSFYSKIPAFPWEIEWRRGDGCQLVQIYLKKK